MDQVKIGKFLKELRTEKGLTQEELSEKFFIHPRTVSRWETGTNMPDLTMLVELADFYEVDIRDIIEGERLDGHSTKETLKTFAKYADEEKEKEQKKIKDKIRLASLLLDLAILSIFVGMWLFSGDIHGILYGIWSHEVCSVFMWTILIVSTIVLSISIGIEENILKKEYITEDKKNKHSLITVIFSVLLGLSLLCFLITDKIYGIAFSTDVRNIIRGIACVMSITYIVHMVMVTTKSFKVYKAKKEIEKESKSSK